ncbi:isoprenoid synthase domain-containing protein [Rhodocollybia butyracea]|uniref:Terpene synthase n=1 Tax=Rhodocollybia butyracea TaxID=206335 RepID=A0A9P5PD08_9AGAR|nr:isoprenoid synthase domain-containing protein [Rhodocollybia butyracea]
METFTLPDLIPVVSSLKTGTNPHYKEAGAESAEWINSYNVFTDSRKAFFVQGCNELLVALTYPYAGYDQFRTCCDFVNLLFVVDEVSDEQNGEDARATGETLLNAMRDPEYDDGSTLCQITKDFRKRYTSTAGPNSLRRFLVHCDNYIECVSREAELREAGEILGLEDFIDLRRENSAIRLCFGLFEYVLGIDLPQEVFDDSTFMEAYWAAADMVCWANDVYSYDMEQSKGISGNNIVTVLMKAKNIDLQAACDHVGTYFNELMDRYVDARARMPSWGPEIDASVAQYLDATAHWIRGNVDWSFESQRYFGSRTLEVRDTRIVHLTPKAPQEMDSDSDSESE